MDLMKGKKGIIFGVSNTHGIAYGIAKQLFEAGADICFTYANAAMEKRVRPIAEEMNSKLVLECDVTNEEQIKSVFAEYEKVYGEMDFMIHAVAFANREDLTGEFINTSREGWDLAMGVSAYSLVSLSRAARPLMKNGGSILAMTYIGAEKMVCNYNIMAVAKSALESSARYLATNLGGENIRVNCISAGPIKTLAAQGISGFGKMLKAATLKAPLKRNVSTDEVGKTALYLLSDLSSAVTGEVVHVDCGCHSVYASIEEMEILTREN